MGIENGIYGQGFMGTSAAVRRARTGNPYVDQQHEDDYQKELADEAALTLQNEKKPFRRVGDLAPGWGDFFDAQERRETSANLRGTASRTSYGGGFGNGTSVREGGQTVATSSPAMRSLNGRGQQQYDPSDDGGAAEYWARRDAGLERAEGRLTAATNALYTPENDLYTGRTAAKARGMGDINRDEFSRDAAAKSQAEVDTYNSQDQMRRDRHFDSVNRLRELQPFDKNYLAAQSRIGSAEITGDSRVDAAQAGAQGRIGSAAINSLGRTSTALTMPSQQPQVDAAINDIRPNVPGAQQGVAPGSKGMFPAARLEEFARAKGFQSAQQARQYLEQIAGYTVQ